MSHRHCRGQRPRSKQGVGLRQNRSKSSPLRTGGFEEDGLLKRLGHSCWLSLPGFPVSDELLLCSGEDLWEDTEGRRVTVALMAGPAQGNKRLQKGALFQTSYQLLGEMVDT